MTSKSLRFGFKTVSEYCSARVPRVGLSNKQATEPYSDNLLSCTRNPSEPYSDKEIPLRRALRRFASLVGLSTGNPPKIGTFTAWNLSGPVRDTPPYRAMPFRDSIAPVSLRYPCWGGLAHLHFACSPRGNAQKRGGGIAPNWPC